MVNDYVYIPISLEIYRELLTRYPANPHTVVENVVYDFLERTVDGVIQERPKSGFMWERLMLPSRTRIRTKYFGEIFEAVVDDRRLIWNEDEFESIAKLINTMRGGTSNNAWRVAEIKRPGDHNWIPAMKLRI